MQYRFAGGVCDQEGEKGFVVLRSDVVAVRLLDGHVLWQRESAGRPVAASPRFLITLDHESEKYVVRWIDAATGLDIARSEAPGLPAWAMASGLNQDALQLEATGTATGIHIAWSISRPFRGGAPPPPGLQADASHRLQGVFFVDLEKPGLSSVEPDSPAAFHQAAMPVNLAAAEVPPASQAGADILAREEVKDRVYLLHARQNPENTTSVELEARDAGNGRQLWLSLLATLPSQRRTPPRPMSKRQ